MATIPTLTEDFAGGALGAAATQANTIFDAATGNGAATFVADPYDATRQMMGMTLAGQNVIRTINTPAKLPVSPLFWLRFDFNIVATPDTNTAIVNVSDPADVKILDLQVIAGTRQLRLRNNNSEAAVTPAFPAGRMRIYVGVNASTVAADRWIRVIVHHEADDPALLVQSYDSGQQASSVSATGVGGFRMGAISNMTGQFRFGRIRADNAAPPYPAVSTAPPANTAAPVVTGSATPRAGEALTSTLGAWTGTPKPTLTRQWEKDGAPINGQTDPTFVPTAPGAYRVAVTGTNTDPGSPVTVRSAAVNVTTAPSTPLTGGSGAQTDTVVLKSGDPTNGVPPYEHGIEQLTGPATTPRLVGGTGRWWAIDKQAAATTWRITVNDAASNPPLVREFTVDPLGSGATASYYGTATGWVAI